MAVTETIWSEHVAGFNKILLCSPLASSHNSSSSLLAGYDIDYNNTLLQTEHVIRYLSKEVKAAQQPTFYTKDEAYISLYLKELERSNRIPVGIEFKENHHFNLYDINQDGTPELILFENSSGAGAHFHFYTIKNGELVDCGEYGRSYLLGNGEGGLIANFGRMDNYQMDEITLVDDAIVITEIASGTDIDPYESYPEPEDYGYVNYEYLPFCPPELPFAFYTYNPHTTNNGVTNPSEEVSISDDENPLYIKAYTDFLLNIYLSGAEDFPTQGYYFMDLNFDQIPELGVLHHSGGSMGGYFTFYYFNGNEITAILNDNNEPVRVSNYTQILADYENENVFLLKEMYLLRGNFNGTYGYIRKIINQADLLRIDNIIDLSVDQERDLEKHYSKDYDNEDDFLTDVELDDCLITRHYFKDEWVDISSEQYLNLKKELIPDRDSLVDLRDTDIFIQRSFIDMADGGAEMYLTNDEIEALLLKWLSRINES